MLTENNFDKDVINEWNEKVQPIIDRLYVYITSHIENPLGFKENMFTSCDPVSIYTLFYNITMNHKFDYVHLNILFQKEMDAIIIFCSKFKIHTLHDIINHFKGFKLLLKWFHCFFHHLNRMNMRVCDQLPVHLQMKKILNDYYIIPQQQYIIELICSQWSAIRKSNYTIDNVLIEIMSIINDVSFTIYPNIEHHYFLKTCDHISLVIEDWHQKEDYLKCMYNMVHFLNLETYMVQTYLNDYQEDYIMTLFRSWIINPYYHHFLNDKTYGWKALLRSGGHKNNIIIGYEFFSSVNDVSVWVETYKEFVQEELIYINKNADVITALHTFLVYQENLLYNILPHKKVIHTLITQLHNGIENLFKSNPHLILQLVQTLEKYLRKKNNQNILQQLCSLICFCYDKETFHSHYKTLFRKRLLLSLYYYDNEKNVLDYLCCKIGKSFALNLMVMLDEIRHKKKSCGNVSLYKLSKVAWDIEKEKSLKYKIPLKIKEKLDALSTEWKQQINPIMKLDLLLSQGNVVISGQYVSGCYEFVMNPIQAIVLLVLENHHYSRQSLLNILEIPDDNEHNVDGVLESLLRCGLIIYVDEKWSWNNFYSCKSSRIIVPPISVKKISANNANDESKKRANYTIETLIVRTLKKNKSMCYKNIIQLVMDNVDTDNKTIKQIIEYLIEREYISCEDDFLHYVP